MGADPPSTPEPAQQPGDHGVELGLPLEDLVVRNGNASQADAFPAPPAAASLRPEGSLSAPARTSARVMLAQSVRPTTTAIEPSCQMHSAAKPAARIAASSSSRGK